VKGKTMATISVIILARNEEHNIYDCIKTVQFADEVLIIDDFSTDKTAIIAKELGARIIQHPLNGDWAQQRRFGVSQTKCDWVLFLDADERISNELSEEIQEVIANNSKISYWIQRSNKFHYNHATHGVLRPDYVLRLMPKDGITIEGAVHERIASSYPSKKLKTSIMLSSFNCIASISKGFLTYFLIIISLLHKHQPMCFCSLITKKRLNIS